MRYELILFILLGLLILYWYWPIMIYEPVNDSWMHSYCSQWVYVNFTNDIVGLENRYCKL